MNEITSIKTQDAAEVFQRQGGMNAAETAYMRGNLEPVAGSVPMSTSKWLNSPLFTHAFTRMGLRRLGRDVACTYDIPDMTRGIADVTDYVAAARAIAEERERNPMFDEWLRERKPIDFDLEHLAKCESGTLGQAVYQFVVGSGMEMRFVHNFEAKTDYEFIMRTTGQTHDLQHLLTGFGPNLAGEHALAMMNVTANARFFSPEVALELSVNNCFVGSTMISRVFFNYPAGTPLMLEATKRGIEAGEALTRPLFMIDYPAYVDRTLEDITRELGFARGPAEAWDYSEQVLGD
jgi:ubiquinone biosynthesis protein Coq4